MREWLIGGQGVGSEGRERWEGCCGGRVVQRAREGWKVGLHERGWVAEVAIGCADVRGCVGDCWWRRETEAEWGNGCHREVLRFEVPWQRGTGQGRAVFKVFAVLGGESSLLHLLPLVLVASVLEPDLHLGFRQVQHGGELLAFVGREVLLHRETSLELVHLRMGEQRPGSPLLVLH